MSKNYSYDYYKVAIPSDCESDGDKRFDIAILQAKELTRLYAMPASWNLVSDDGETVIVRRKRAKHTRPHYHAMNGSVGCLPDNNEVHTSKKAACQSLASLFDETKGLYSQLMKYEIYYSSDENPLLGADYCEVVKCHDLTCLESEE